MPCASRSKNDILNKVSNQRSMARLGLGPRPRNLQSLVYLKRLVGCVLWHVNLWRLFNAKSIFIQIISSISNNSV